jgi:integrase
MPDPFSKLQSLDGEHFALAPVPGDLDALSAELARLRTRSADYATRSFGAGTLRAYRSAWRGYAAWCSGHCLDPFGGAAGPVRLYVTHLADLQRSVSTIRVLLAAIATAYRLSGLALDLNDPILGPVVEGIARSIGTRPRRQATPAVPEVLRAMVAQCGRDEIMRAALCARNRAMILIGFGAAMRRSEVVALKMGDVALVEGRGVTVTVQRSKTDQQGEGAKTAICSNQTEPEMCPYHALERWFIFRKAARDMGEDGTADRPLFCAVTKGGVITGQGLSDKAVVRLVKELATAAGYDPELFAGHSLRAGLITAAGDAGLELAGAMRQARQTDPATTMRYYRPADLWRNNVTAKIFISDDFKK